MVHSDFSPQARSNFQQIYQQLNQAQKQAVDVIEGPVMVIAGPGTGKTQVLAARIANILLTTDTNPSSVLALTFTESAAKNMRQRLVSMIGKTGYYVQIHTFHSFCADIISSHPEYFSIDRDSQPLSELERFNILQQVIDVLPLVALKPLNTPYFYLKDCIKKISDLKREGVSVSEFAKIVAAEQTLYAAESDALSKTEKTKREKLITKNQELLQIYGSYQEKITASLRFDFDDMIALVVEAFKTQSDLLTEYQERLLYFLVDEYQDTNSAQNQVVDLLASFWGEAANIFVVGDPNQAIYRFQGASLENVLGFTKRYSQALVVTLTTGYRSPQNIYDAAADLIKENQNVVTDWELSAQLASVKKNHSDIELFIAPSQTLESVYVAGKISELLKADVPANEIAILYRNHADVIDVLPALEKWGIRYEVDGGNNVLEAPHICQLLKLFRIIHQISLGEVDGELFAVLQYEWLGLEPLLVMKVARAASLAKLSLFEILHKGYEFFLEQYQTSDVTAVDFAVLKDIIDTMVGWAARDAQLTFTAWFELVINESGFLPWVMAQPNKIELLNTVNSLFREVRALTTAHRDFQLHDFLEIIDTLEAHHLSILAEDLNVTENAVHLSTVHKAKGQEWGHVFIIRCVDGKWGNGRNRDLIPLPSGILKNSDLSSKERNEDDRRLFFVAMTRAKEKLVITYPETIITENHSKAVVGSLFLKEIKTHLHADVSHTAQDVVRKADQHLAQLLGSVPVREVVDSQTAFFSEVVSDFKLSVTALNTYLRSPKDFVTECLLKVPTAKSPTLAFGSAIHAALEHWFKAWQKNEEQPSSATLLTAFEESLTKEPLTSAEFEKRLIYGKKVLTGYFSELQKITNPPIFIERFFGFGWSKTMLDDVHLTGRIDRVDWIDPQKQTVCLVDYKTGRARTVGEIEATVAAAELSERERSLPKSIRGSYKRQLLFYKLLTQLDRSFVPTVEEAVFDFVEPDKQSGKFIQRRFSLPDSEVMELTVVIKEVMKEIRGLEFLKYL